MSRWHEKSCFTPEIIIQNGVPRCKTCDACPNLEILSRQMKTAQKPWSGPPDELLGQMNLYWPASVPYKRDSDLLASHTEHSYADAASNHLDTTHPSATSLLTAPTRTPSFIYDRRLASDELRLLALSGAASDDEPIHVSLDNFSDDEHPEYETVSYTWGGEENDMSRVYPAYIGEYWDVSFQTHNCRDMLQYLRPRRGPRILWVDSICINQDDLTEVDAQVAKMRSIYQQCMRVVVFLGKAIVQPTNMDRPAYPKRRLFHEVLDKPYSTYIDLKRLLQTRYFR